MEFQRVPCLIGLGLLMGTAVDAGAEAFKTIKTKVGVEACRTAVLRQHPGTIVKLEFKTERRIPIYEFEIVGKDAKTWEIECDAFEGRIVEQEQEVASADDVQFKQKAKISEEVARGIALAVHPGTVIATEYEIEANGDASYEFDIRLQDGSEVKLEVDAASGRIVEDDEQEWYQIGRD